MVCWSFSWFCIDRNFCLEFGCLLRNRGRERGLALLSDLGEVLSSSSRVSAAGVCFSLGVKFKFKLKASAGESKVCIPDFIFVSSRGV